MPFNCTKCGLCCRSVGNTELTLYLSRGDGVCRFFDELSMLCKIYDRRPDVCKVEESYVSFSGFNCIEEYFRANENVCKALQFANKI